ncbi:MAG: beta-N-acetylhexosaminidase family protein [Thermoguttaceae bacterium]
MLRAAMKKILLALVCLVLHWPCLDAAELARDGATTWIIVLPDQPTPVEKTAARELAEHLKQVTGAQFAVIAEKDAPPQGKSLIFVGNTAKAPKKEYPFDEILIRTDGGNLVLAGHAKRGCLYAVYSFLQDQVGVRWWAPDETFAPTRPTLVIPDRLDVSYAPPMISREMYHRKAQPTVFSARMKGNGSLTPEYGGAVRIVNFVHSF